MIDYGTGTNTKRSDTHSGRDRRGVRVIVSTGSREPRPTSPATVITPPRTTSAQSAREHRKVLTNPSNRSKTGIPRWEIHRRNTAGPAGYRSLEQPIHDVPPCPNAETRTTRCSRPEDWTVETVIIRIDADH
ncbi:hypothetical protein [Saliphagus sp. LR7]|uniref:hypothetical protein n=1 Tax=Saliphagus sp. LR7 TaxID=2282654 RepID=UPI001300B782|nr:hypothetical protein [Saliphagus sp. LR7]